MRMRSRLAALATAVAAVVPAGILAGAPAHAAGFTEIGIHSSSHCLDNATENSAVLQMWNCTGGSEQKWLEEFNTTTGFFTFTNQHTGLCVSTVGPADNRVEMDICDGAAPAREQWRLYLATSDANGPYKIWQNVLNNMCLNTSSVANGTLLRVVTCDPTNHYQKFDER